MGVGGGGCGFLGGMCWRNTCFLFLDEKLYFYMLFRCEGRGVGWVAMHIVLRIEDFGISPAAHVYPRPSTVS